ncbi:MAG: DUF2000 domain-containing protein [Candidatus Dormibacteraeota bacterium]|nr:DUF2000 domain-containing protein [Candidatus Dormibacteraeota bacterium]
MRFPTKIAVAVRDDLETWQRVNVTAFLAGAVAGAHPAAIGEPYEDGSGNRYLPTFREPVLVYAGPATVLERCRTRALTRGLATAIYTMPMFETDNDDDNRAVVRAVAAGELDLAGVAVYGERAAVDRVFDKIRLHP